jgi:hypothetical protein
MRLKVKENERLVRDSDNFAILNTDRAALSTHQSKIERLIQERAKAVEINNIKDQITEIRDMLAKIMQQSSNK